MARFRCYAHVTFIANGDCPPCLTDRLNSLRSGTARHKELGDSLKQLDPIEQIILLEVQVVQPPCFEMGRVRWCEKHMLAFGVDEIGRLPEEEESEYDEDDEYAHY